MDISSLSELSDELLGLIASTPCESLVYSEKMNLLIRNLQCRLKSDKRRQLPTFDSPTIFTPSIAQQSAFINGIQPRLEADALPYVSSGMLPIK